MANDATKVMFKKGTHAHLNELTSSQIVDGSFYLTTDTNRLFIGKENGKLEELNQSITIIENITELNKIKMKDIETGQFYYVSGSMGTDAETAQGGNILVVALGPRSDDPEKPNWVQINPDTYYHLMADTKALQVGSENNNITINMAVKDTKAPGAGTAPGTTVSGKVTFSEGDNVQLAAEENTITIAAKDTHYKLKTESIANNNTDAKITLDSTDNNDDTNITLKGGTGITVQVTDTVDANSDHKEITISGSNPIKSVDTSFDKDGQLITTLGVDGDSPIIDTNPSTPTIYYGTKTEQNQYPGIATFKNGVATLEVFTKNEVTQRINQALSGAQAMSYQGVAASYNDLDTENALAGYTYKASTTFNIADTDSATGQTVSANVGDLIIAELDANNNVKWAIVPSGDDQFISANISASNNSIQLQDGLNSGILAGIVLQDGDLIDVNSSVSGNILTATIKHTAPTSESGSAITAGTGNTQSINNDFKVNIVDSLSKDSYGHITDVSLKEYTFKHAGVSTTGTVVFNDDTDTLSYGFKYGDNTVGAASLKLKSDTLTFSKDSSDANAHVRAEILWGSF